MTGAMKVHLYQVHGLVPNTSLDSLIEAALQTPLEDRLRVIVRNEMRLEEAHRPSSQGNRHPVWLMDFTKLRFENGPGKASRSEPIEGFELEDDEGFGEETAALYDPATRHILVQYNHHGPRAGSIAAYLTSCGDGDEGSFEFQIRLDEEAEAKLANKQIIKKLHFKIAPPRMTDAMRQSGVSIERALELSEDVNGQTIEVIVSAGRGQLAQGRVTRTINALKRLHRSGHGDGIGPLETFKVHARDGLDDATEMIDMLSPTMEVEIDGLVLGDDRRYTRRSRWDALLRARAGWQRVMRP